MCTRMAEDVSNQNMIIIIPQLWILIFLLSHQRLWVPSIWNIEDTLKTKATFVDQATTKRLNIHVVLR